MCLRTRAAIGWRVKKTPYVRNVLSGSGAALRLPAGTLVFPRARVGVPVPCCAQERVARHLRCAKSACTHGSGASLTAGASACTDTRCRPTRLAHAAPLARPRSKQSAGHHTDMEANVPGRRQGLADTRATHGRHLRITALVRWHTLGQRARPNSRNGTVSAVLADTRGDPRTPAAVRARLPRPLLNDTRRQTAGSYTEMVCLPRVSMPRPTHIYFVEPTLCARPNELEAPVLCACRRPPNVARGNAIRGYIVCGEQRSVKVEATDVRHTMDSNLHVHSLAARAVATIFDAHGRAYAGRRPVLLFCCCRAHAADIVVTLTPARSIRSACIQQTQNTRTYSSVQHQDLLACRT